MIPTSYDVCVDSDYIRSIKSGAEWLINKGRYSGMVEIEPSEEKLIFAAALVPAYKRGLVNICFAGSS